MLGYLWDRYRVVAAHTGQYTGTTTHVYSLPFLTRWGAERWIRELEWERSYERGSTVETSYSVIRTGERVR